MSEREVFERRLEASVRGYVEAAPTQIDAARLTDSLATNVPRMRRLVPVPAWRLPSLGFSWILVVAGLLAVLGMGLLASGALRDLHLLPTPPMPSQTLLTPPAVIASPVATSSSVPQTSSPAPTATVGSPQAVTITSLMVLSAAGPNTGTFDARGEASERGLICERGTVADLVVVDGDGIQSGRVLEWTVPKEFSCADGSGTVNVEVKAHIDPILKTEAFTWRVVSGTGAYAHLRGAGNGTTESPAAGQAVNTYTGSLVN